MGDITTLPWGYWRGHTSAKRWPRPAIHRLGKENGLTRTRSSLEFAGCASDVSPRGEARSAHLAHLSGVPCKGGYQFT